MISVVCVYNNKKILNEFLLKSLKNQNVKYELILVDNTKEEFKSASEALNYGGNKAEGNYIMFVHQDMDLLSKDWLKNAEDMLNSLKNMGISGIAGRSKNKPWTITNIKDGMPPSIVSPEEIIEPVSVQTLDECLIVIPRSVFEKHKFDEVTCDDWHLYAVDYSLNIKKEGYEVYVIPMYAYHRSKAYSFSESYYDILEKILKKHRSEYTCILTTVGDWVTFYPLKLQKSFPWIKDKIINYFKKNG